MRYTEKPWLKSYKLGPYPLDKSLEPYPREPVFKALDNAAEKYPDKVALLFESRTVKYRELKRLSDRLANGLAGLGVGKSDKVALFLPNCVEAIVSDWAILKTGGVVVPISILRSDDGLKHEAGSSDSKVIICHEEQLDQVVRVKERCSIEWIVVATMDGYNDTKAEQPFPFDENKSYPAGVVTFGKLLADSDPEPPVVDIDPLEDLCELAFTGGATGVPKGVMITHHNRYSCIHQGFPWMMKPLIKGFTGKASILLPVPLFHSYGRYMAQSAAFLGLRIILIKDPRDTAGIVELIKKHKPLMIAAVPTQLMRIAQMKIGKMTVLPMSGAAPLPAEVAATIKKEMGMPVSEGYGLTETSPLTHFNISTFSKITGFIANLKSGLGVPSPDTECKLVDPVTREEVPFGEAGEIFVRGPQIMKGYWPEPGSGLTDDGWLPTGDIAYMDEDGYFHMTDRTKDMVNVSGNKVYTTEVDEVLYKHPGILLAAAYGVPDPQNPGSERVMVSIQLKEDYSTPVTEEEIKDFCRDKLAPYAVPKYVEFRQDMPLTVTEKIFKKVLREEAVKKLQENKEKS